jgi:hypothetical protein
MIAALICVISLAALLQFFILYSRSLIAAYGKVELSPQVQEATGLTGASVSAEEFRRLLQLVRLCPERGDDGIEIRAVGAYYGLLGLCVAACRMFAPTAALWAKHERESCSYFAAVALDRRIAHSRSLVAQEMGGGGV